MKNLDLVIACDTSIAHLAGALGVPVWLALPLVPDWRWLLERPDSPWYPTMRLFRQTEFGQWDDLIERMAVQMRGIEKSSGGSMATIAETFALALRHHQAGGFYHAEQLYRQILQVDPANADPGVFSARLPGTGQSRGSGKTLSPGTQVMPGHPTAYNCLGIVLAQQGKLAESVASFQQASRCDPGKRRNPQQSGRRPYPGRPRRRGGL